MLLASPRSYMLLSVAAAVATILLKTWAWRLTGSVGLMSDAMESGVNLVAAIGAFWALTLAAKPADRNHHYGHFKAEYFSSGLESVLIVAAALAIIFAAVGRLQQPQPLEQLGIGLAISLLATALNGLVAWVLLRAAKRFHSITLRADAHHLLTDVWTSFGVVLGIGLVKVTGLTILDPLIAIAVALNIIITGWRLFHETASGLLDRSLSDDDHRVLEQVLASYETEDIRFHALRTRVAGSRRFVSLHVLVPGRWTVQAGHDLCEQIEKEIAATLTRTHVLTHLEPLEDPSSWDDQGFRWEES
ncbi:cation transporter [Vulcanococcus limneticus Candia 3F8]|uniref:cation diffusion facilitator family transporter n=1 Tax=Vulcanococcus limneticus TaxID=2170428 RepID=UPI000B9931C4|nr:cation diffusion facilitator family transporter [Vulcanococcus limneticus]MCP9793090.1 cation transporter [Vulcanococcus limneticus MW73D5]MCP9895076.1 cation transporter [Vulcanococcus limneticus Candia 3F8]MCP9898493.1 cation transporter [Vulcanococcus limneticus Candia 3B3]